MDSYVLEDINALLNLKKGDASRLNHIKQLCEANEIVSLSDRRYIERLVTQYIRKTVPPELKTQQKPKIEAIKESNVAISDLAKKTSEIHLPEKMQSVEHSKSEKTLSVPFDLSYNKKILFGIGAIVLAVILIAAVAIGNEGIQVKEKSEIIKSATSPGFSLEIDESSYETADIISISGQVSSSSGTVDLSIQNQDGKTIWEENLNAKKNGEFSTLLIAGGSGWENSGKYILRGQHNEISNEISFDFLARK